MYVYMIRLYNKYYIIYICIYEINDIWDFLENNMIIRYLKSFF